MQREIKRTALSGAAVGKGNFRHFMEKELHEHPAVLGDTLRRMVNPGTRAVALPDLPFDLARIPRITISACGSAFYAGLVGRYWFEQVARMPTDGDVASEFRYRAPPLEPGGLGLLVSQSGETADTLAALRYHAERAAARAVGGERAGKHHGARERRGAADHRRARDRRRQHQGVHRPARRAGLPGACRRARPRHAERGARKRAMTAALLEVPGRAAEVLEHDDAIRRIAARVAEARDVLYLGRGDCFPIAMEGALKLKEISYIHAEGYAAGEMKHGPIALIDRTVPVIAIVPVRAAVREDRVATCRRRRRAAARSSCSATPPGRRS